MFGVDGPWTYAKFGKKAAPGLLVTTGEHGGGVLGHPDAELVEAPLSGVGSPGCGTGKTDGGSGAPIDVEPVIDLHF